MQESFFELNLFDQKNQSFQSNFYFDKLEFSNISSINKTMFAQSFHFICKKCWRIPTLKFIKKNKLLYTCKCKESPREIFIKNIYDFLVDINKNKVDIYEVLKCKIDENEKKIFFIVKSEKK